MLTCQHVRHSLCVCAASGTPACNIAALPAADLQTQKAYQSYFSPTEQVTDFGLSKIVEEGLSMQSTQSPVNPRWLAPEILAGARATTASDVFSYGALLAAQL